MSVDQLAVEATEHESIDAFPNPASLDSETLNDVAATFSSVQRDDNAISRRRRDVRAARDRLGEQFHQLRSVLPEPPPGVELTGKAHVLEHSLDVIQKLMKKATHLTMELAVVSPEKTKEWVAKISEEGTKPLLEAVSDVMKLFAARCGWRYGEWWTLDEQQNVNAEEKSPSSLGSEKDHDANNSDENDTMMKDDKPSGVLDDPTNVHGCVVRDSISVMRLAWTLIHRPPELDGNNNNMEQKKEFAALSEFARASSKFEFKPRVGMPGRVWSSRRPEWLINLLDREAFIRSPLAKQFGMRTCLAVPVQFGGHVHSVMAFYSHERREYDPDIYELATLLAKCLEEVYSPSNNGPWQLSGEVLYRAH